VKHDTWEKAWRPIKPMKLIYLNFFSSFSCTTQNSSREAKTNETLTERVEWFISITVQEEEQRRHRGTQRDDWFHFYNSITSRKEINKHWTTIHEASSLAIYLFKIHFFFEFNNFFGRPKKKLFSIEKSFFNIHLSVEKVHKLCFATTKDRAREHFSTICMFCAIFGSTDMILRFMFDRYLLNIWGYMNWKHFFFILSK
jgi:hypothetical protein